MAKLKMVYTLEQELKEDEAELLKKNLEDAGEEKKEELKRGLDYETFIEDGRFETSTLTIDILEEKK